MDDSINILNYEIFEVYKVKKIGIHKNLMHNKFCIIDLKTVIHGSFNWTTKANYNRETIEIIHGFGHEHVEKFLNQFIELKREFLYNRIGSLSK